MKLTSQNICKFMYDAKENGRIPNYDGYPKLEEVICGEANIVYVISCGNSNYAVRASGYQDLKEAHKYEFDLLSRIRTSEMSPRPFLYDENYFENPISVVEYIQGKICTPDIFSFDINQLNNLIKRVQQIDKKLFNERSFFGITKDCFEFAHSIVSYEEKQLKELSTDISTETYNFLSSRINLDRTYIDYHKSLLLTVPLVPVHLSIHPGNIVISHANWKLIDWQRAGLGDPALEYSLLICKNSLTNNAKFQLLDEVKCQDSSFEQRINLYERLFSLFTTLWCGVRSKRISTGEFNEEFLQSKSKLAYSEKFRSLLENMVRQ